MRWKAVIRSGKLRHVAVTVIVAPEHDLGAGNALMRVLRELGVEEVSRHHAMAGSQEINTLRFALNGHPLSRPRPTWGYP